MENLYAYIKNRTGLSRESWTALKEVLTTQSYQEGESLLDVGEVCKSVFFITKGYCRAVYHHDGKEINTNFYFENELATNIRSLKQEEGSAYRIQAEEDSNAVIFDKAKLYALFSRSSEIDAIGRKLMEGMLARQEEQAKLFKLHTAQQRYDYMMRIQPQIIVRVPLENIASYLGITLDTLHRIHQGR